MTFQEILNKCKDIHKKKSQDYTTNPSIDKFENFTRANEIASWFAKNEDKAFAVLVGVKLARLGSLLSSGRTPNNESIEDSFIDLITYCTIWAEMNSPNILVGKSVEWERQLLNEPNVSEF